MQILHAGHDARCALRVMHRQPFTEQRTQLPRQAQHGVEGRARTCLMGGFQHVFHVFGDERYLRRHAHANRYARVGQRADGAQAPVGRGGARLHAAGQYRVERGDGDVHRRQALRGQRGQKIQVALHSAGLGDERKRVARLLHHLDQAAGELQLALHRLVAIGGRSNVHQPGHVARLGQLAAQHLGNVVLGHNLRFKIQPR